MRILLVEDNIDFANTIEKAIRAIDGCELTWRRSKAGALRSLADEPFDVVILDRRIPTDDDVLDDHQDHGWAVFQSVVDNWPGTSVWFLTGTVDPDFPTDVLNVHGMRGDIHGCGREDPVYRVFWKNKMPECIAAVRSFRGDVQHTDGIHLTQVGVPANLRAEEVRLLKLFGRKHNGVALEVRPLMGGLSGARVVLVSVFDSAGAVIISSVAKVGPFGEIAVERTKYRSEIVKLAPGCFPQVTGEIGLGASQYAGIFYAVVGTNVRSLFDELVDDPGRCAEIPALLRADQATWLGVKQNERVRVSAVRRLLVGDVVLQQLAAELGDIETPPVEAVEIDVSRCVQHGDLHCANVLFDGNGRPMFIDYPETGRSFASLDPVVMELSTIFHKDAPDRKGWPSPEQAADWTNIDSFSAGAPYESYLKECRAWAHTVAGSQQEVWAVGYGYALRQLKYADTNKVLARAIIRSCISRLLGIAVAND